MMTENDIVEAVCRKLIDLGFDIRQALSTQEQGVDIIAEKAALKMYIEAKGETSASPTSKRFGQPFNSNQIVNHVARALHTVAKLLSEQGMDNENFKVAIALPYNDGHKQQINAIRPVIKKLGVTLFWVKSKDVVFIES